MNDLKLCSVTCTKQQKDSNLDWNKQKNMCLHFYPLNFHCIYKNKTLPIQMLWWAADVT